MNSCGWNGTNGAALFVDLASILIEGGLDYIAGRPEAENPYCPISARRAYEAWAWGHDEMRIQFELRGHHEIARWLADAA